MSSVFITTKIANSIPAIVKVCLIELYVIKYVFDLLQGSGCLWVLIYVSNKWHGTKRYDWKIVDSCVDYLNILEIIEETL